MKKRFITLLLILGVVKISAQTLPKVSENFRIHPSPVTQTEVLVERHPLNPDLLFATANTITFAPFFVSEGVYVSENGGLSWSGSDTCNGAPIAFHGGDPGIAINKNGRFILTRLGTDPFAGLYAHYSDDNGASWSSQLTITTDDVERASVVTDASPVSRLPFTLLTPMTASIGVCRSASIIPLKILPVPILKSDATARFTSPGRGLRAYPHFRKF